MQLMLYVEDVQAATKFWQSFGFVLLDRQEIDGTLVIELAPSIDADVRFVLYEKAFVEKHSPEIALYSPSLMFFSENILALHEKMAAKGVEVGDLIQMDQRLVFNFADCDGNYFAVSGNLDSEN